MINPLNVSDMLMTLFMVWPHKPARLQQFLYYLNSLRSTIKFTMEIEVSGTVPFLDILIMKQKKKNRPCA
jgi:hypothetical protein